MIGPTGADDDVPAVAVDSSVAIAGFAPWHERHADAVKLLRPSPAIPAHAALECYSVLTRLPEPYRASPDIAAEFLRRQFPERLTLSAAHQRNRVRDVHAIGVSGGSVYDALVALTCRAAGRTLHSFDVRAAAVYRRCDIEFSLTG